MAAWARSLGGTFLQAAGAAAATGLVVRPAWAEPDPAFAPFLHGVASGDPLPDGVILWTRVTQSSKAPVTVARRVATDLGMKNVVTKGDAVTGADRDYTVKVDVRRGTRDPAIYSERLPAGVVQRQNISFPS